MLLLKYVMMQEMYLNILKHYKRKEKSESNFDKIVLSNLMNSKLLVIT